MVNLDEFWHVPGGGWIGCQQGGGRRFQDEQKDGEVEVVGSLDDLLCCLPLVPAKDPASNRHRDAGGGQNHQQLRDEEGRGQRCRKQRWSTRFFV